MKFSLKGIKKLASKVAFEAAKHSPELLIGGGVVLGITSAVMYIKSTKKASDEFDVIEEKQKAYEKWQNSVNEAKENGTKEEVKVVLENEPEKISVKDIAVFTVKHYALPTFVAAASLGCFIGSYAILNSRLKAVTAALSTATAQYAAFRKEAVNELGEEKVKRMEKPVTVTQKAQGKRPEVVEKDNKKGKANYGFWYSKSTRYARDDVDYNTRVIEKINDDIVSYLMTHEVITLNQIRGRHFFDTGDKDIQGGVMGYDITTWTSVSVEEGDIISDVDEKGNTYYDIWIPLPAPKYVYMADELDIHEM